MGSLTSIFNSWISDMRTKQAIRNIEQNNELRKNITRYERSDIEGFIERDLNVGSYVISGNSSIYRSKAAASIAACAIDQGVPTIILHEGNIGLENSVIRYQQYIPNHSIISKGSAVYDPFFNRSSQEIANLITSSASQNSAIGAIGQQYIMGIADFIKTKNIPPYCEMFLSCPHDHLLDKIDEAESKNYIRTAQASQIRNMIMQGQAERPSIQSFFSQLSCQGCGIIANGRKNNSSVNIKSSVAKNGLIMIDIGSSTNELLLNIIINEIKEILASGKQIMLILDGIHISSNDLLSKLVRSLSSRCLTALLSDDVYSMLGADENVFNAFVGNANKCIVFAHTAGVSCNKWSEVFGYYDVNKVTQSTGNNQNYQWGYGFGTNNSISVSTSREFIVKPEELTRMSYDEVFILDRNVRELAYAPLN